MVGHWEIGKIGIDYSREDKMKARYGGDYSMASLRLFVASKTGLSITMEGCIK